jgi:uncharacterized protein (TIGR02996 family)
MRTFEQKKTQRFWSIQRDKKKITTTYGKIGGKPTTRTTTFSELVLVLEKYQRQINEKLSAGYKETTTDDVPLMDATGRAILDALVENPDELANHLAFADWLSEQADPRHQARGEFVRLQLRLEDEALTAEQRKKLKKREKELLDADERRWLGWRLYDVLFDGGSDTWVYADTARPDGVRRYRRGWVDRLNVPLMTDQVARTIADAPALRLLREMVIGDHLYETGTMAALASTDTLKNLRVLHVIDHDEDQDVSRLVARMPRLEELRLEVMNQEIGKLFSLKTLGNLRDLHVEYAAEYDVQALAKNETLGNLRRLALMPDWTARENGPPVRLKDVRALANSKHLKSLTALTITRTDAGDDGVRAIIDSGLLGRLTELDLSDGCITDRGALELAAAPGFATLKKLTMTYNRLTRAGMRALRREGLTLDVSDQQEADDGEYGDDYLYDDWDEDSELYDEIME